LVDPAVDADLMALGDDPALLVGMQQSHDRRNVESCADAEALEQCKDARHADARTVLAPAQPPDRLAAVAQLVGLVIGIEGERDRAACAVLPGFGPIGPAGADVADQFAPVFLRPLPRLELGNLLRHGSLLFMRWVSRSPAAPGR